MESVPQGRMALEGQNNSGSTTQSVLSEPNMLLLHMHHGDCTILTILKVFTVVNSPEVVSDRCPEVNQLHVMKIKKKRHWGWQA